MKLTGWQDLCPRVESMNRPSIGTIALTAILGTRDLATEEILADFACQRPGSPAFENPRGRTLSSDGCRITFVSWRVSQEVNVCCVIFFS